MRWLIGLALTVLACRAGVLAESTFETGDEGWRVGDLTGVGPLLAPARVDAGGNPGGFLRAQDVFWWTMFVAPAEYLGDQSAAYGGQIRFDQRELENTGGTAPAVALEGAGLRLGHAGAMPGTRWTTIVVPLTPGGWVNSATLAPATEEELRAALGSLTALRINADYLDGADQVDLDNVKLSTATPEPGTPALLTVGMWVMTRRRVRRTRGGSMAG